MNLKDKLYEDCTLLKSLFTKEELFSLHFLLLLISILTVPLIFAFLIYHHL